jgi:hypothetical protein
MVLGLAFLFLHGPDAGDDFAGGGAERVEVGFGGLASDKEGREGLAVDVDEDAVRALGDFDLSGGECGEGEEGGEERKEPHLSQ